MAGDLLGAAYDWPYFIHTHVCLYSGSRRTADYRPGSRLMLRRRDRGCFD